MLAGGRGIVNAQPVSGRALNVITRALAERKPLEILMLKGCGRKTFLEIVALMQSNGYWSEYDKHGIPKWSTRLNEQEAREKNRSV